MSPGRLVYAVLMALVLLAAGCGGGEGGSSGGGGGGSAEQDGGGGKNGDGGNGGGDGDEDGDQNSEFAVDTELDLGQAFAEEPMFDGALGPVTVTVRTDRGGGSNAQVPIAFRLANTGQASLDDVSITFRFTVLPGKEPEDPAVPGPDDPALELAPQTTAGTCAAENTTSSGTTIACTIGTFASGEEATITVTSPRWFRLSIKMELTARGP